mmetsp:Transcript_107535/g.283565  ORF Transcript_107535/g.283565 Transcript_107535/m.283565 type:complete len:270 (+) Transcript_107535:14-823(+)
MGVCRRGRWLPGEGQRDGRAAPRGPAGVQVRRLQGEQPPHRPALRGPRHVLRVLRVPVAGLGLHASRLRRAPRLQRRCGAAGGPARAAGEPARAAGGAAAAEHWRGRFSASHRAAAGVAGGPSPASGAGRHVASSSSAAGVPAAAAPAARRRPGGGRAPAAADGQLALPLPSWKPGARPLRARAPRPRRGLQFPAGDVAHRRPRGGVPGGALRGAPVRGGAVPARRAGGHCRGPGGASDREPAAGKLQRRCLLRCAMWLRVGPLPVVEH